MINFIESRLAYKSFCNFSKALSQVSGGWKGLA